MWFPIVSISKGSMGNHSVRRIECACCWILSHGLLQVIDKCTVRIHDCIYKIFASCIGVTCLVSGGVMGIDVCADHLCTVVCDCCSDNEIPLLCWLFLLLLSFKVILVINYAQAIPVEWLVANPLPYFTSSKLWGTSSVCSADIWGDMLVSSPRLHLL